MQRDCPHPFDWDKLTMKQYGVTVLVPWGEFYGIPSLILITLANDLERIIGQSEMALQKRDLKP